MHKIMEVVSNQEVESSFDTPEVKHSGDYLHHIFQQQAEISPNNIAVVADEAQLTYAELDQHSNKLMWFLKSKNIEKGQFVAILSERNDWALSAMLAVLKLGAAYIPLDPDYPAERINYILNDCEASLLITTSHMLDMHAELSWPSLVLDKEINSVASQPDTYLSPEEIGLQTDSPCYVIYTSGTTGRPKGVLIEHRSVCNYLQSIKKIYQLSQEDCIFQGFSLAFDASVEEVWSAFISGATLYTTRDKALRSGLGLVEFLNKNKITFLSTTPSLLATLEPSIPSLRLLILGGEVCQQDLVKRWFREGLRIINTYGPTEATVVTTFCEYHPEKPLTIGRPLPNYEVFLLNSDLQPVDQEEAGELCIAGVCLARGYINRPELNEAKFIHHVGLGNKRLYRTGDLCKRLPNGDLQFIGRTDNQIKLRGFRIELNEIESVIMEYPGISNDVVALKKLPSGNEVLVAYLILNDKKFAKDNLANFLKSRLPEYMVPSFYEVIEKFPLLHSGKIDYKNLPIPSDEVQRDDFILPATKAEKVIAKVWQEVFKCERVSVNDNFFYDLGGHSLLAARTVSLLRKEPEFAHLSIVDIYQNPTIKKLALKINDKITKNEKTNDAAASGYGKRATKWEYYLCAFMQFLGCTLQYAIISWEFLAIIAVLTYSIKRNTEYSLQTLGILAAIVLLLPIALLSFSILSKWLLLGRIKPGTYKLWGAYYFRWWLFTRIERTFAPILHLVGSPLMNIYCRLMGAKIGKNCYIATPNIYAFDLLKIEEDSSISQDASLSGYIVQDGFLKIGPINIGKRCLVGARSVLEINTTLEDDSILGDLSMLPANTIMPKGSHFSGSPAKKIGENKQLKTSDAASTWLNVKFTALHYVAMIFISIIYYLSYIPGTLLIDYFYRQQGLLTSIFLGTPLASLLFILLFCTCVFLVNRVLVGKIKPGTYKVKSWFYVRKWLAERLMASPEVEVLAETVYFPPFLRLLGSKIGKRVEMADIAHITPSLFKLHDESFSASAVMFGVPHIYLGNVTYDMMEIGKRTFIGSAVVIPSGTKLGDHCLIGSLSIAPDKVNSAKSNNGWLGSPPIHLPKRETPEQFPEELIFNPTKLLFFARAGIEIIRIILPSIFYFCMLIGFVGAWSFLNANFTFLGMFLLFPLFSIVIILALGGIAISIKWLLMGKFKPMTKPLWSFFIRKRDIVEQLNNLFFDRVLLEPLLGTPFAACLLRLLGVKIGKRAFINTTRFAEYDLIKIGDDVTLNTDCLMLTHLYEDRIFKMSYIEIGDRCSVGNLSVVIYDTQMENDSSLGSLSLLMKGEHLPENSCWQGSPSQPIS